MIYNQASVYQYRNLQDLVSNLENEIYGYRNTTALLFELKDYLKYLPEVTQKFWNAYRKHFKR